MSANAVAAAATTGVRLLRVLRPAWLPGPGDRWTEVPAMPAAARALGEVPKRVFLTIGQRDLAAFAEAPHHWYLVRSVDPPAPESLPPQATVIAARGPFGAAEEQALLAARGIQVIVTKNAGGAATEGKLAAARALGIPVVMAARPAEPPAETVRDVAAALAWLARLHEGTRASRGV